MKGNTNINWIEMTDAAIVEQIGRFIKQSRIEQNKTQLQLAKEAGLNRWTLSQIENGGTVNLSSLIQLLRALDVLYVLNHFELIEEISPLAYAKLRKKKKQRVRDKKNDNNNQTEDIGW